MSGELLRFGPFELDPDREELRRSGLVLRIPRQPLRILLLLVSRAGEVVTRDDIHAAIWGSETYVDFEHGINSAIRQIRFALGDRAETPRYVRTLPRRGYSFIAAVERVAKPGESASVAVPAAAVPTPPAARPRLTLRVLAVAAVALLVLTAVGALIAASRERPSGGRTIAVEPFRRLGPPIAGVDERSFAGELRATIGTLPPAHVSLVVSDRADLVVSGTIREAEDGVRVIVSLADAASRTQVWTGTFQRPATRKEGMTVEVAHRVMHELARRYLPPPRREPPLVTNASKTAIALYRRARTQSARSQAYDWMRTKELYEEAVAEEPRFAEAWSGLGDVWCNRALRGPLAERETAAARAAQYARRALSVQPRNPEALTILGLIAAQRDFDLAAAEETMRRAVAADPGYVDARTNLSMILTMRGQADEALQEWEIARQLDPVMHDLAPAEAFLFLYARRYDDARARYRDILAVHPESQRAFWGLMFTCMARRNWSEAIALANTVRPDGGASVPATEAGFMEVYRALEPHLLELHRRDRVNEYFLALYYSQTGRPERAFELLHRAVDRRVPMMSYIMVDPRLDNLRGDPRFDALLARMNLGRPPQPLRIASR
ncbi:MAG TPA: tetratricopeptide repeat protein [Thermoanaerobaculia bacterium]|jgi:DNA-binding winged helix-turn-helix (wHTH) protein/tetratricopeptide (TPR) repeat protein